MIERASASPTTWCRCVNLKPASSNSKQQRLPWFGTEQKYSLVHATTFSLGFLEAMRWSEAKDIGSGENRGGPCIGFVQPAGIRFAGPFLHALPSSAGQLWACGMRSVAARGRGVGTHELLPTRISLPPAASPSVRGKEHTRLASSLAASGGNFAMANSPQPMVLSLAPVEVSHWRWHFVALPRSSCPRRQHDVVVHAIRHSRQTD